MRRRVALVLAVMALALLLASGVAWAVNKVGTDGPDTLTGTNGDDNLIGKGGNDELFSLNGRDNLLGGRARIASSALLSNTASSQATRTFLEVPATISFGRAKVPTTWRAGKATIFSPTTACASSRKTISPEGQATT